MRRRHRSGGYTAVEVAIASSIMLFIAGGSVSVMKTGTDSWNGVRQQTRKHAMVQHALHEVVKTAKSAINVTLDNSDPDSVMATFQVPIKRTADGTIEYGAFMRTIQDGKARLTPKKGFWSRLVVRTVTDPSGKSIRQLVVRTLDTNATNQKGMDHVLAQPVDNAWGSRKGFQIAESGGIYSILLRLKSPDGKRREARTSAGSQSVDMANVDSTANDFTGLDTTQLSLGIMSLQSLLTASNGTPFEPALQEALDHANEALNLVNGDLLGAMQALESGVAAVQDAIADGLSPTVGDPIMDGVAAVARQFAGDAQTQAATQDATSSDLANATLAITNGDAYRAAGDFKAAVNKYRNAVSSVL